MAILAAVLMLAAVDDEAFFTAIRARDTKAVEAMLESKPELLKARLRGLSPVMAALFVSNKGFIPAKENETLAAVLRHKPELDVWEASGAGDVARMRELLREDASRATAWHPVGWTPLHIAAFGGHVEVVQLLLDNGAASQINARAKTKFKNTPLQTAMLTGQYGTSKLLLERGADALVRQNEGFAPIHEAALLGRRDLIDLLIAHGAELSSRSDDGRTPLSEAARGKHAEIVEYLKSKGAKNVTADLTKSPE